MGNRRDDLLKEALEFLNYADVAFKGTTVQTYTTSIRKFYDFLRSKYPSEENLLEKIDRPFMEAWFKDMFDAGLKPPSRFLALMNIRCYLSWAFERGYIDQDPRQSFIRVSDFPKKPEYLPKPLEPDHDKKLQAYLEKSHLLTEKGLLLLRYTGMRVGELLGSPCDCLHQEEDGTYSIKIPLGKLDTERLVPLTQEGVNLVHQLQSMARSQKYTWQRQDCCHCGQGRYAKVTVEQDMENLKLMTGQSGHQISYSGMRAAMNRACETAEIPHYAVHQLRHTFATSLLNAGVSLASVMKLLGHKKISMTLRYAEITQKTIREEYFAAIEKTKEQYDIQTPYEEEISDPLTSLNDLIKLVEKKRQELPDPKTDKKKLNLLKRLRRLEDELQKVF